MAMEEDRLQKITSHTSHRTAAHHFVPAFLPPTTRPTRMNHVSAEQCSQPTESPQLKPVDPMAPQIGTPGTAGRPSSPPTATERSATAQPPQKLSVSEKIPLSTLTNVSLLSEVLVRCLAASHSAVSTAVAVAAAAAARSCSAAGCIE